MFLALRVVRANFVPNTLSSMAVATTLSLLTQRNAWKCLNARYLVKSLCTLSPNVDWYSCGNDAYKHQQNDCAIHKYNGSDYSTSSGEILNWLLLSLKLQYLKQEKTSGRVVEHHTTNLNLCSNSRYRWIARISF